jgi:hypothetical protein
VFRHLLPRILLKWNEVDRERQNTNKMKNAASSLICLGLLLGGSASLAAQSFSSAVVLSEPGFPAADSASPSSGVLETALPGAHFVSAAQLAAQLEVPATQLLVLPYGSAFPEAAWGPIYQFLQHGGNLLVLGGRPFTRAAHHDASGWKLREYGVRFTRPLMIDQYQDTAASDGFEFRTNPELTLQLPRFGWKRAFSPVIRLSAVDLYHRGGAAGSIDARVDAFAWGVQGGHKMSAPAIQVDHWRNGFEGGRWIFLNAELAPDFYSNSAASKTVGALAERALEGSQEFTVRPTLPLYLPGEPVQVEVLYHAAVPPSSALSVRIKMYPEGQAPNAATTASIPAAGLVSLPAPGTKGLYVIEAELLEGDKVRAIYHSGFWIRDEEYLRSGPRMTVNKDYFEIDGQPLAVVGTTYMSSEAQRLYFEHPNVYVWNQDLAQIHAAGLNMIRTGWWTGWDKFCDENGQPYDRTLRTMEAYLMTARKNGLPIQFNFFAFLPEVLGGANAFLDPDAVRRQQTLVSSVVTRFHDVPWLAWDFINEPSISQYLWKMRANGDSIELQKWNEWLNKRYPDRVALAAAWNVPASSVEGTVPVPDEIEFAPRGMYVGRNSLRTYDFFLFAQDVFSHWVHEMCGVVRATGSQQLVTVGQDEGGIQDRLSPAYWGEQVSFTTNHSWWQVDYSLWDSLLAKQPGQTMLIQETGLQRELNLDETERRSPENEAALLERKIASSLIQGSGAIEWLWNSNSYMTESNETPIGAVRPDATEKPEATLLRDYATFSKALSPHLRNPQQPSIAIVTSQAAQFSVIGDLQLEAQRKAVRALAYNDRLTAYAIAENQIDKLGTPKLAILPSAQTLTDKAWRVLLKYANDGGNLLITGPVEHDEHWHTASRIAEFKLDAQTEPLVVHNATVQLGNRVQQLSFNQQDQSWLDDLRFADASTFKELSYGKGRIFWTAFPVELAEGTDAAASLYAYVAGKVGITSQYDLTAPLSPGVLVYPIVLEDSVLYVMESDSADDANIDLRDKLTETHLTLRLPAQHAALAVLGKQTKSVVAKYGF